MRLANFMLIVYDNSQSCQMALEKLQNPEFLNQNGWFEVFHEGVGNGICSPEENLVAVFDEDGLPKFHSVQFYRYDKDAWKETANGGWDRIYAGDNGENFDVHPVKVKLHCKV